jgi:hypothetical protein
MMETDWGVAAAADDPVIELAWQDAATGLRFVELRMVAEEQRARIAALPEAAGRPALAQALTEWNDPDGLLLTAKCDGWVMDAAELAALADALDAPVEQHGRASYIDVLLAHAIPRADFLLHEEWARAAAIACAALPYPAARLDLVIRPARVEEAWGYGLSVYIYAAGATAEQAEEHWAAALTGCVPPLRAAAEGMMVPPEQVQPDQMPPV